MELVGQPALLVAACAVLAALAVAAREVAAGVPRAAGGDPWRWSSAAPAAKAPTVPDGARRPRTFNNGATSGGDARNGLVQRSTDRH